MIYRHPVNAGKLLFQRVAAFVLTVAVLSGLVMLPSARAENTGTLTAKVVLRKSADKDSKALQTLPEGDEVDLLGVSDGWYKIRYGSYTGYVMLVFEAVHLLYIYLSGIQLDFGHYQRAFISVAYTTLLAGVLQFPIRWWLGIYKLKRAR